MPITVRSFHFLAYRFSGGGLLFKIADHQGADTRFAIALEALTHFQKQIEDFVAKNSDMRDNNLSLERFWNDLVASRPSVTEQDINGLGENAFKAAFQLSPLQDHILLRTFDINAGIQDFVLSYETLWCMGIAIEDWIAKLRS